MIEPRKGAKDAKPDRTPYRTAEAWSEGAATDSNAQQERRDTKIAEKKSCSESGLVLGSNLSEMEHTTEYTEYTEKERSTASTENQPVEHKGRKEREGSRLFLCFEIL